MAGILSRCKYAFFDMDGTLLDSTKYWRYGSIEYLNRHNYIVPKEIEAHVFECPGIDTLRKLKYELGYDIDLEEAGKSIADNMIEHYRNDVEAKPFVGEMFKLLNEKGIKIIITTATQDKYAVPALARFSLDKYFEFVYDEVKAGCPKGNPKYFTSLLQLLNIKNTECAFFDDTLTPLKTAKSVGIYAVGVEDSCQYLYKDEIIKTADHYLSSFEDINKLF